jgi:hypothetical protein
MPTVHVTGRLLRKCLNRGSKSEHWGFVLETSDGDQLTVEKREDNPFEPLSLEPLADHRVEASGEMYRGRLLVDLIRAVED